MAVPETMINKKFLENWVDSTDEGRLFLSCQFCREMPSSSPTSSPSSSTSTSTTQLTPTSTPTPSSTTSPSTNLYAGLSRLFAAASPSFTSSKSSSTTSPSSNPYEGISHLFDSFTSSSTTSPSTTSSDNPYEGISLLFASAPSSEDDKSRSNVPKYVQGRYPFELHLDYIVRQGGYGKPPEPSFLGDGYVLPPQ